MEADISRNKDNSAQPVLKAEHADAPPPALEWTDDSVRIRTEVALLTGLSPDLVNENMSLPEFGLDSVDTIKLSARLKMVGISLSNSELIRGKTIARLSQILASGKAKMVGPPTSGLKEMDEVTASLRQHLTDLRHDLKHVDVVLPSTPLQEAMVADMIAIWFPSILQSRHLVSIGNGRHSALPDACTRCSWSPPILRTGFVHVESPSIGSTFCQIVGTDFRLPCTNVVLDNFDDISRVTDNARLRCCGGGWGV